jgi:hypothetical protein
MLSTALGQFLTSGERELNLIVLEVLAVLRSRKMKTGYKTYGIAWKPNMPVPYVSVAPACVLPSILVTVSCA